MYYWKLEPYTGQKSRHTCPNCGKKNEYTRYINSGGEYAPFEFGVCNRKEKCGYSRYPSKDEVRTESKPFIPVPEPPQEFMQWEEISDALELDNNLFQYLSSLFGQEATLEAFRRYFVSTEGNKVIFPFIDSRGRLTQAKTLGYDQQGHRLKTKSKGIGFAYKGNRNLKIGLFGEHLLETGTIPHIVEAEKTALICSIVYPEYTWLAVGGLELIKNTFHLKEAVLYPDKGRAFEIWKERSPNRFQFDKTVEESDLEEGADLADIICQMV